MNVRLVLGQWKRLQLDDPDNLEVARALFFLGYGIELISDFTKKPKADPERFDAIATATAMGLAECDRITLVHPTTEKGEA